MQGKRPEVQDTQDSKVRTVQPKEIQGLRRYENPIRKQLYEDNHKKTGYQCDNRNADSKKSNENIIENL